MENVVKNVKFLNEEFGRIVKSIGDFTLRCPDNIEYEIE